MCLSGGTAHVDERGIPVEVALEALVSIKLNKVSFSTVGIVMSWN